MRASAALEPAASWWATINWFDVAAGLLVPSAAILISTLVAVRLARAERRDNVASLRRERLLAAASPLFEDLAALIPLDPEREDWTPHLVRMRAHIAAFRAALDLPDVAVHDWIGLRHREGMHLWEQTGKRLPIAPGFPDVAHITGPNVEGIRTARAWSNETIQQLQGWLTGFIPLEWFESDSRRIAELYGIGSPTGSETQA